MLEGFVRSPFLRAAVMATAMLIAVGEARAQSQQSVAPERVDAIFSAYANDASPGAAVLVARNGKTVFASGYGLADLASGRPLTPATPIRLGSLTKQFTAVAIMMLLQDGAVSFDDPAAKWVPELERFGRITIRHLLTHTSGLPDYYDRISVQKGTETGDALLTADSAVRIYEEWGELEFPIGSAYQYSNPGYEVLGLILERASGQSYSDFMDSRIFEPLGMTASTVRDTPQREIQDRAIGYRPAGADSAWTELDAHPLNWILGAGGIYSSVDDLRRWDAVLSAGALLDQETLAQALTPVTLSGGEPYPYGFGWSLDDKVGHRAIHHTGSWVGFRTAMANFPDEGLLVVVLSNASGPAEELLDQVARLYLGAGG